MSNHSPLPGTGSEDFERWFAANSANGSAFAVLAARTTQPPMDGTGWIQTTRQVGMGNSGSGILKRIKDYIFGAAVARNIVQLRFIGVGSSNDTTNWKISGANKSVYRGAAGTSNPVDLWVPTPLAIGTFTLGTKATGTGVTNEKYADTITYNETTGAGAQARVWTFSVASGLLSDDVATLEIDFTGFEFLLLETDILSGTTANNAEYRLL